MESSDQAEINEAEIGQPLTSERNSSSDSDSEEVVKSFTKLSIYPPISTISVKKREELEKFLKKYKENKEKFLRCTKELIGVSSILRRDKGETISKEKYKNLLREKFENTDYWNGNFAWEDYRIELPRDIELAKESSKYSVDKIISLTIIIEELNENEIGCLKKFLRSFAYTQIKEIYFGGHITCSEIKEHGIIHCDYLHKVYPCSNFFEELRYVVSRVSNEIEIYKLELSSREFIQLVKAAKKAKELRIWDCKISFDSEFEFGPMDGCLIREIHIGYSYQVYDEWSEYEKCLMKTFRGILNCKNLIMSLEDLDFKCTHGLKEKMIEEAKKILGEDYLKIMPSLKRFIDC